MRANSKQYFSIVLAGILIVQGFLIGIVPTPTVYAANPETEAEPTRQAIIDLLTVGEERSFWLCTHFDHTKMWLNSVLGEIVTQDYMMLAPRWERGDHGGGPTVVPVWENNRVFLNDIESMARVTEMMAYKECVLDPVAHALKGFLVDEITNDILEWVAVGFDGGPMFLTSPNRYWKEVSYELLRMFITEEDIYGMRIEEHFSTPFAQGVVQDFVRSATTPDYHQVPAYSNYGSTIDPDLYTSLTQGIPIERYTLQARKLLKEGNNPISASFNIAEVAGVRINQVVENEKTLASYGSGFLSPRCDISNTSDPYVTVCTPGAIVMSQVDDWLGGALGQLENAAESGAILNEGYARIVERILIPNTNDVERGLLTGDWRTAENESNNPFLYTDVLREFKQHTGTGDGAWERTDTQRFEDLWNNPPPPPDDFISPSTAPTSTITPPSDDDWSCSWEWNYVTGSWYAQCCLWGYCVTIGG